MRNYSNEINHSELSLKRFQNNYIRVLKKKKKNKKIKLKSFHTFIQMHID